MSNPTRIERIREIYKNHGKPWDDIWAYCCDGNSKKERYFRFRAAQQWAASKRQKGNRDGDSYKQWKHRENAYRQHKRLVLKRIHRNDKPPTGTGPWGGSQSVCEREVVPVYTRFGVPVTSRKRTVTLGNPSSDHYVGNTTAYAVDGGTFNGADCARAVANNLGIGGYSTGNYNNYYINRSGKQFRIQILWAVSGHFNHVHTGARS